ncbi:MAG TPA: ADYC domain-containing protein [Kofleriaceae bacterium]|nr:ADYC domain-containing protein [Kofleriaceae bacterium]
MTRIELRIAILSVLVAGGCALPEDVGALAREGKSLNGKSLNGKSLNGTELGGAVTWVSLDGIRLDGRWRLDDAWLDGTELVGRIGPFVVRGSALRQAELQAMSDTGVPLRLRVRDVDRPGAGGGAWRYRVEVRDDHGWSPICEEGGAELAAYAVSGWWRPQEGVPGGGDKVTGDDRFTFACPRLGAIGKCIELGYRPWASAGDVPLERHHQSCVRALRADYCGDGASHTVDGTLINIYDALGLQVDTEEWTFEAEWYSGGARCFSDDNRALEHVPCYAERSSDTCGDPSHFEDGTRLMTEME